MPVFETKRDDKGRRERTGQADYVGLVLTLGAEEIRIMSDVWATGYYALVWDTAAPKKVWMGDSEFGCTAEAEVDATPETVAAFEAWKAEQARLADEREHKAAEERAKHRVLAPKMGVLVRVVKGRKVPKGTEGVVTWMGPGSYGPRVGIKDAAGTVHWTAEENVERVVERLENEEWHELENRLYRAAPSKWSRVRFVAGTDAPAGTEGTVIFSRDERVGVATSNRKANGRYVDVVWTSAVSVETVETNFCEPAWVDVSVAPADKQVVIPF